MLAISSVKNRIMSDVCFKCMQEFISMHSLSEYCYWMLLTASVSVFAGHFCVSCS